MVHGHAVLTQLLLDEAAVVHQEFALRLRAALILLLLGTALVRQVVQVELRDAPLDLLMAILIVKLGANASRPIGT